MRLIDADAITEDERQEYGFFYNSDLQELLDEQPTIDISNTPNTLGALESIQTTQLTDEDKETIRIHLNAFKESLCNQGRWYEATEYEELIHRLLSTSSVQPELSSNSKELENKNGELISRQEAIEAIKELCEHYTPTKSTTHPHMDFVIEELQKLPSAQPQWIPCSERLPDIKENHVSEPCIVYCENGAYGFTELEENIFGQVGWYCERGDEFHESLGKVLAWMPVPKPYQEDKDGK